MEFEEEYLNDEQKYKKPIGIEEAWKKGEGRLAKWEGSASAPMEGSTAQKEQEV